MVIVNVEPEGQGGESDQPAARGCGTTTTILKCTKSTSPEAKVESDLQHQAEKDMKNKILKENNIHATALHPFLSQEEETEQKQEEKVRGPSVLPPAPGGGERAASKQTDAVK